MKRINKKHPDGTTSETRELSDIEHARESMNSVLHSLIWAGCVIGIMVIIYLINALP